MNVVSNEYDKPPVTFTVIVLRPRLSLASTWNAITVSTVLPDADKFTDGGILSATVFVGVVPSELQAPAISATIAAKPMRVVCD